MMRSKLAISAALLALTASAASAQVRGPAIPSRDPSGRATFGQSSLPITNGGAGAAFAGQAFPAQSPFIGAQPFNPGFIQSPSFVNNGFTGFGSNGFTPGFATGANPAFNSGFATGLSPGFNTGFVPTNAGAPVLGTADPRLLAPGFVDTRVPAVAGVDAFGNPVFFSTAASAAPAAFGTGTTGFVGVDQFGNPVLGSQFGNQFGFTPGFGGTPFGTGFFGGPYGGVVPLNNQGFAPTYDPSMGVRANGGFGRGGGPAVAGLNSPPLTRVAFQPAAPGARYLVRMDPKTPEDMDRAARIRVEEDVAGTREEYRGANRDQGTALENTNVQNTEPEVKTSPATRDQVMLAEKLDALMAERPMREGLVTRISKGNVEVQYQCRGESRTESFPAGEVFFFRTSGAIATAAMAPGTLKVGDHVLVACNDEPRQAVAGSRQEMRSGHRDHNAAATGTSTRSGSNAGRARRSRQERGRVNSLGEK